MGEGASADDLDGMLDGLTSGAKVEQDKPAEPSAAPPAAPPPLVRGADTHAEKSAEADPAVDEDADAGQPEPPPLVRRTIQNPDDYTARTEFPDLFAADNAAMPALTGLEGKVTYLRDKLKRRETQLARV